MSHMTTNIMNRKTGWFEQVQGSNGRMFVEDGNSAFYEGRQYFTFKEFSIATAGVGVFKVVITENVIMRDFFVVLELSNARVEIVTGGTEGGTFNSALPLMQTNNTTTVPDRVSTSNMTYGGTLTGGTTLDLFLLNSGNNLNQAVGQQGGEAFPIGFAPGTYYVRITNTGNTTATGLFKARWTEDPN